MSASNFSDYADFCAALVRRYKGTVEAVEVWNEPQGGWMWTPGNGGVNGNYPGTTGALYANLLKAAYPAIKAADPTVKVLAGSIFCCQWSDWRISYYLTNLYGQHAPFDVLSVHNYPQHVIGKYPSSVWIDTN